jgi:hypothetical protein
MVRCFAEGSVVVPGSALQPCGSLIMTPEGV